MENLKEEKIIKDLLPQEFGKQGNIWVISLIFFVQFKFLNKKKVYFNNFKIIFLNI